MKASAFRDFIGTSDVLKLFNIARAVSECNLKIIVKFENFQNVML